MTSASPVTWHAMLGEHPTVTRTVAPDVSLGTVIGFAPARRSGALHPPVTAVRRGAGTGAARRVGAGVAAGRGARAARGVADVSATSVARTAAGVEGDGSPDSRLIAAGEVVDTGDAAAVAADLPAGADGTGLDGVGAAVGDATGVNWAGDGEVLRTSDGAAVGVAGKVISSSPRALESIPGAANVVPVVPSRPTAGMSVVMAPNTAPPASNAAHAITRFRGVSCMTCRSRFRCPLRGWWRASGARR